ncbi:Manganese-dependent 2,3-dihydroxybiphenyl 1,2-dioxygenase [Candidatus Thermoflexus japonica]|uniref:Manganese-dependent 2,3-dihydroxybiphenyl 1,2-dioxygenase n=1 Tax=Candidatus Thermoflexus japonica TaxID=2035417 RepID=A0A2H5Y5Z0_9CHLR|nr:Manganese-dependent 2,3-dihydroxybiphenyl 1,2-dioxygenase [Candidatus Thermoflexus japonica]
MGEFSITRAAHAELCVTDLERARDFYVEALGFVEVAREKDRLYLGGLEERDRYSLILRKGDSPGVTHLAFRVADPADLDRLADLYARAGCPIRWLAPEEEETGQGRALRVQDPTGLPIEFFHEIARRERLLQRFDLYRGAHIMRLDHFNCQVPNVQEAYDWWAGKLGFYCSEYTVTDEEPPRLWAAWLHRKQNVHDIALMNGIGPRLHHIGFWVADTQSVLRACDILAARGMGEAIERGPGRHGLSNAFFLYLRDPDGNRIELYTNDYLIPDPDWEPIRWSINDPRRATFWGHIPPRSWFEEASRVAHILTGEWMPVREPMLVDRPVFVT